MDVVRFGPATRGDMEVLVEYVREAPSSVRTGAPSLPLSDQFDDFKVSAVMDKFYEKLRDGICVALQDDDSFFLEAHDWQTKLGDAEGTILQSVKRFILHAAIHCASSRPTDFAFDKYTEDGKKQRQIKVDCLYDFVKDVVQLAKFLKDSAEAKGHLPSLKDFVRSRIARIDALERQGRRPGRRHWFAPNSERSTHAYARQACCVIMGLTDDYDQRPIFGLNNWNKDILVFDNLEQLLWKGFGLKFRGHEAELATMSGSIVDLDANFIASGPFTFTATTRVQRHLTLDRQGRIRIYVSRGLELTAFMFQSHLIARSLLFSSELTIEPPISRISVLRLADHTHSSSYSLDIPPPDPGKLRKASASIWIKSL